MVNLWSGKNDGATYRKMGCLEKDLRTACVFCTFASSSPMIWPRGHLPTPSWGIPHGDQEKEEELHLQAAAAQGRALCQVKGTKQLFSHPHLWQGVTHRHWGWQVGTSSLQEEDGRNPWTIFKWRMQIPLFRLLDQVFFFSFYLFIYLFIFVIFFEFTCLPHPDPHSHLPLHPLPPGLPRAPGLSACLMHPTWAGNLFHPWQYTCFDAVLLKHPTLAFSHRV